MGSISLLLGVDNLIYLDRCWVCIPVVAESYGAWGKEATKLFSTITSRISKPKYVTLNDIYGRLKLYNWLGKMPPPS